MSRKLSIETCKKSGQQIVLQIRKKFANFKKNLQKCQNFMSKNCI